MTHAGGAGCECSACKGVERITPVTHANPPGLHTLAYRVGTHGQFKESMLTAIGRQPALDRLTTRADDDPSIALIDAWAASLDVLAFHQERYANENYLMTATERRSVLELARMIGYELRPGVAASTVLAYGLETAPGSPPIVNIPAGAQVMTTPAQDETPQTFETANALEARIAWNNFTPVRWATKIPLPNDNFVRLAGAAVNVRPGDVILIVGDERRTNAASDMVAIRRAVNMTAVPATATAPGYTDVALDRPLDQNTPLSNPRFYVLHQRAGLFGATASDWNSMSDTARAPFLSVAGLTSSSDWPGLSLQDIALRAAPAERPTINLDRIVPGIGADQWVVLSNAQNSRAYSVIDAADDGLTAFGIMGHSTRLRLSGSGLPNLFDNAIRSTSVFAVSEEIGFGAAPIVTALSGDTLAVAESAADLPAGRVLIVAGIDFDSGAPQSEVVTVKSIASAGSQIVLTGPLAHRYVLAATAILGNCVAATHGARIPRPEALGAGDGSRRFQTFTLKQKPLTYTTAANAAGVASTLDVKVNDISWTQVPSLYGAGSSARVFVTRRADDGTVRVMFGNGITGVRLPTGVENVVADYRTGIGLPGMVQANQINIALTRPVGVSAVTNPAPSAGAQDPERLVDARANAPLTVLTLDRVVSVADYADFARAFAGVGKAQASLVWSGERRIVHVTVASATGAALPAASGTFKNLTAAIDALAPADHHFAIDDYVPRPFRLKAAILPAAGLDFAVAAARVRAALLAGFSFAARELGRSVTVSEIIAAIQKVDGVAAAQLLLLDFIVPDPANRRDDRLIAGMPQSSSGVVTPAILIMLAPGGIELVEMAS